MVNAGGLELENHFVAIMTKTISEKTYEWMLNLGRNFDYKDIWWSQSVTDALLLIREGENRKDTVFSSGCT